MDFTNVLLICIIVYAVVLFCKGIVSQRRKSGKVKGRIIAKKTLHENFVLYRKKAGLEPEDVADAVGVAWAQVIKWESGSEDPGTNNLLALAKLYKVSAQELLDEVH